MLGPLVLKSHKSLAAFVLSLVTMLSVSACSAGPEVAASKSSDIIAPNSEYSPTDVTRLQLEALKKNDEPVEGSGIAIAFRFASPGNKTATGPVDRFSLIFQNPAYAPMLNHLNVQYGDLQLDGLTAIQPVIITGRSGRRVGYFFFLSKQEGGECDQCWMTDSVVPFEVDQPGEQETQVI